VVEAITELRRTGYTIAVHGEALRIVHGGQEAPDRLKIIPCLEALKQSKAEALECLRAEDEARQERAAIIHHDGGLPPDEAERLSWCFTVCMLTPGMAKLCQRARPCPKYGTVR
jgi:hypothetical protein